MRRYLTRADFTKLQANPATVFDRDTVVVTDEVTKPMYTYNSATNSWDALVTSQTNPLTGNIIKNIWNGTQAQYDALAVKDDSTLYVIVA